MAPIACASRIRSPSRTIGSGFRTEEQSLVRIDVMESARSIPAKSVRPRSVS